MTRSQFYAMPIEEQRRLRDEQDADMEARNLDDTWERMASQDTLLGGKVPPLLMVYDEESPGKILSVLPYLPGGRLIENDSDGMCEREQEEKLKIYRHLVATGQAPAKHLPENQDAC